jgi:hypothetical protein
VLDDRSRKSERAERAARFIRERGPAVADENELEFLVVLARHRLEGREETFGPIARGENDGDGGHV